MVTSTLIQERNELLSKSCEAQSQEAIQLRERIVNMSPVAAKQEAKIDELSNTLMALRQYTDRLQNENQQMKIEREVWKTSEARALKESQEFLRERNSANERLAEIQRSFNDREHFHETQIKKMDTRGENISRDLQVTRKQLAEIMNDHRALTARRDAELKESQIKTERLTAESEKAKNENSEVLKREELLNDRLQDTLKLLEESEEKLLAYKGRDLNRQIPGSSLQDPVRNIEMALAQAK